MKEYPSFGTISPGRYGTLWYEGPDKDLMAFKAVNFSLSPRDSDNNYSYTAQLSDGTGRCPPAFYTFNPNWLGTITEPCDKDWSYKANRIRNTLTVTAPTGVLHEAFFDPVDIGDAVGVEAGHGVIKPVLFTLNGATTAISSLKSARRRRDADHGPR